MARVVGTVVATRKEDTLEGTKFLLLQPTTSKASPEGTAIVAADVVGAGVGDLVMFVQGSAARQTEQTRDRPVDATVMAIVDLVEDKGNLTYRKEDD